MTWIPDDLRWRRVARAIAQGEQERTRVQVDAALERAKLGRAKRRARKVVPVDFQRRASRSSSLMSSSAIPESE